MKKKIVIIILTLVIMLSILPLNALASPWNINEVYAHNRAIFDTRQTCEDALAFYLLPKNYSLRGNVKNIIQSNAPEIISLAQEITDGIMSDFEKARAISNWVARNIRFDSSRIGKGDDALLVLETRRTTCNGFSALTIALLRATGIPSKYVEGYALGIPRGPHAWVEAFVDDRWVIIDPTWMVNNSARYFDISLRELSRTHRYDEPKFFISGQFFVNYEKTHVLGHFIDADVEEIIFPEGIVQILDLHVYHNNPYEEFGTLPFANLSYVRFPESLTMLSTRMFANSPLEEFVLPGNLRTIGAKVFMETSVTEIKIPDSVTNIDFHAFANTRLENICLPNSVRNISPGAFENTALTNVIIPNSITVIRDRVFANTPLEVIYIPEGVDRIWSESFYNVENLTIFGYAGSVAETHARNRGFNFVEVTSTVAFEDGFVIYNGSIIGTYNLGAEAIIPYDVSGIGDYVFAHFEAVYVPPSVLNISDSAFGNGVIIYGKPDSVAQAFAEERGIAFIAAYGLREPMAVPEVIDVDETIIYVSINEEAENVTPSPLIILIAALSGAILIALVIAVFILRKYKRKRKK